VHRLHTALLSSIRFPSPLHLRVVNSFTLGFEVLFMGILIINLFIVWLLNQNRNQFWMDTDSDGFGDDDPLTGEAVTSFSDKFENYIKPYPLPAASRTNNVDFALQEFVETVAGDCDRSTARSQLRFPWEHSGSWNPFSNTSFDFGLGGLLEHEGLTGAYRPPSVEPAQTTLSKIGSGAFAGAVTRVRRLPWPQQQSAKRNKAVLRWRFVLEEHLTSSKLGRQIQELVLSMGTDAEIQTLIDDTLQGKSTGTLEKRGLSVMAYAKWHRATYGTASIPISEHRVYDYVKDLRLKKAKPTKAASFISALNFSAFAFSLQGALEAASSLRVKGAANDQFSRKRILKQKRKLSVDEVRILENMVMHYQDPRDAVAAGFFVSQLHSRARFSDLQLSQSLILDLLEDGGGFLEFQCLQVKTSVTKESKTTFMPHVCPSVGVLGTAWGKAWTDLMLQQGLIEADPYDFDLFVFTRGCVLPEPLRDGSWGVGPCTSSECSAWLRALLKHGGAVGVDLEVATHSLKSTPLSWCAKFGISITDREILGHHSLGQHKSAHTYSRDSQARPLKLYQGVLLAIKEGKFHPDCTRSGRFFNAKHRSTLKTACPVEPPAVIDSAEAESFSPFHVSQPSPSSPSPEPPAQETQEVSDESSSYESSDSDSTDTDVSIPEFVSRDRGGVEMKKTLDNLAVGSVVYLHSVSSIVHFRSVDEPAKFHCGRLNSTMFSKLRPPHSMESIKFALLCKQCFGK
jgi:hypothetical protein